MPFQTPDRWSEISIFLGEKIEFGNFPCFLLLCTNFGRIFDKFSKKYGGKYFVCESSTDIVSATSKFLIGETITGANSKGIVVDVDPTMCRIGVDVEKGFVDPILSTGSSSSKSITPTSIIDMQDGVAYYVKDGIKSTHFVSGATAKTIYEDEFEKNEEKRKIKIIRPNMIGRIVSQFEKVMKS